MNKDSFERPFPALTVAERVHLDIYGYVVVKNVLSSVEVKAISEKIYEIEAIYRKNGKLPLKINGCCFSKELFRIDNLPHIDKCFFDYLTHPRIVGMAEEAIGGAARLEQSDAHIRRPPPDKSKQLYEFHTGTKLSGAIRNGLYHFPFVKALTNLTDLGPDDGGTVVIAGSHKFEEVDQEAVIKAADEDPSLIHQVIAPAGSTLLFFESLIHGSGIIRSDKDRLLIIGGYTPTMFQTWEGYGVACSDPDPEFLSQVDPKYRSFLDGSNGWLWQSKYRKI